MRPFWDSDRKALFFCLSAQLQSYSMIVDEVANNKQMERLPIKVLSSPLQSGTISLRLKNGDHNI